MAWNKSLLTQLRSGKRDVRELKPKAAGGRRRTVAHSETEMRAKEPSLPFDVEIELLDSLHGSLGALAAGTFGVSAAALICGYASQNALLRRLSLLLLAAAVVRYVTTLAYRRAKRDFDAAGLKRWKIRTTLSASTFSLLLGLCGATGLVQIADASIDIPLITAVIGYAAASASRNAGLPACVRSQVLLAVSPLCLAFLFLGGPASVAIAVLLFIAMFAMIEVTRSVYRTLVNALILAREKHALADAFANQAANFNAALSNMSHGLAMFDAEGDLVICNRRFAEFFRLDDESGAKGASPAQIIRCAARAGLVSLETIGNVEEQFVAKAKCRSAEEMTLALRDGRMIELSFQATAHGGAVVIVHDVTERRAQQAKIAHMARFDNLTGLPNRSQFEERFAELLARNTRTEKPFAVVCIDLDHFKEVNDTLTHMVGDQLLVAVAARMRGAIRVLRPSRPFRRRRIRAHPALARQGDGRRRRLRRPPAPDGRRRAAL